MVWKNVVFTYVKLKFILNSDQFEFIKENLTKEQQKLIEIYIQKEIEKEK